MGPRPEAMPQERVQLGGYDVRVALGGHGEDGECAATVRGGDGLSAALEDVPQRAHLKTYEDKRASENIGR